MNASTPTYDLTEVAQFVTFWMMVTGVYHITLVAILPDGPTTARTFQRGDDHEMATWVTDAQRAGQNIYWQANETFPECASKPGKNQMLAGLSRFADIDPVRTFRRRRRSYSCRTISIPTSRPHSTKLLPLPSQSARREVRAALHSQTRQLAGHG